MRDRKGYLEISKHGKKGCVKMALDDLWKERKDKDRSREEKTGESEKYSSGARYDCSVQFWSSFSRIKAAASATKYGDKCGRSMPFLEDSEYNDNDVRDKEDLSNSDNKGKMVKCSNKENKKVHADTTSQMISNQSSHGAKHYVSKSQNSVRKIKFEHMMDERRKYLLNKYKIKKRIHESTNKELNTSNNASEKISSSNKTNRVQVPVQIDREKLKITSPVGLSVKEVNNGKSSYYKSETMEADSTVLNDKKDDIHISKNKNINKTKDVSRHELCQFVTSDKFKDSFNVSTVSNKNYMSIQERKRKRIKKRFRYYFDKCLTMSEEEEEESIIDKCIYKRQKNDFNEILNDSTNIESRTVLDMTLRQTEVQDITTNLALCENITNNINCTETSEIVNVKQVETVSSIMGITECNNNKTVSDNDTFALHNESPVDKDLHIEEIAESALLNNDEEIQTLSNELQIKIVNCFSENQSLHSENNAEGKHVEKPSTLKKSIDAEGDALPDSNINNDNCNDTSMKVLANYPIKIKTVSEKRSNNNNVDEITCHASKTNYIKESHLITDFDDSGTVHKVSNSTLDSALPVEEILEISKNTENQSKTLQDNVSIDITMHKESAMIANINFTYTETSKCTLRNSDTSQQNITNDVSKIYKECTKNVGEDLSQLLEMDINQNHTIQSDGNTISIQENLEKDTNLYVTAKDTSISEITNKETEISSKLSVSTTEVRLLEKYSTMVTDIGLKDNINTHNAQSKDDAVVPILSDEEAKLSTDNNRVDNISPIESDTSKQHTLLDCIAKNTDNSKQSETTQPSKIRVLSSAELGSRWCLTPVNNLASSSVTESKLSSHTSTDLIKDNEPYKDATTDTAFNYNSISDDIRLTLSYISNIMMRIRTIEKKYNNCQNMIAGNSKTISDDEQFKSNFTVLLQEFVNLGEQLKIFDIDKVVQYAISIINKQLPSQCEPISGNELSRYMEALNWKTLKSIAAIPSSDVSAFDEQSTNLDSVHTVTTKPVPNVSNNPNVVPVTLSFIPTVSQSYIPYNNLPRQNIYAPNISNQNHEYNISNLQAMQKPSTTISYIPSMQPTYKNMKVLQESRTLNTNVPYYQRLIQQQHIPVVTMNTVPNVNVMQLKSNIQIASRLNMHQKPQEGLIRNKPEFLIGQSGIPQRVPQQTMSHNIPQGSQKPQGSQTYISQNAQNTQVSYSTTLPTHSSQIRSINTISHELAFKIWDQLTYCLEKKIIDCRLHDAYDKTYCPLQLFHDKWKQAMNNFIYRKMQLKHDEPIMLKSSEARHMRSIHVRDKWKYEQLLVKNKEPQKQHILTNILSKKIKRKNLFSPPGVKAPNVIVQSEVTQHKTRKYTRNVEFEKQQQSHTQTNLQLLNNMVASVDEAVSNVSGKNNSVLVGSNFTNFDNTTVLSFTSLEGKTEKQKNMLKTDGVSSSESDNIKAIEVTHVHKDSLLPEQTVKEIVHVQEENSLAEQTIREVVHTQEENSLPEQTITEVVHVQEKNSLAEQTIREVIHTQEENSLPEQTITEVVDVQEKDSLTEQTIREVVHTEKESLLSEQTTRETVIRGKEHGSLIGQIIRDNTNYLQCDLIQSATLSDPHIVDVRSISPTSFNKMDNMFALNNPELSSNKSTENNEIKVKIEIPNDVSKPCLRCSKKSEVVCEVCIQAHYCSAECSVLHWMSEHHKYCKPHNLRSSEECDNDAPTEDSDFDVDYMKVP